MKAVRVKKLYDGTLQKPLEHAVVVFDEKCIANVIQGFSGTFLEQFGIAVEDCLNCVMTPGLIDSHVHLMLPGDGTLGEDLLRNRSLGEIQMLAFRNAMSALDSGVTTLRDVGAAADIALNARAYFSGVETLGPDILCCGMPVTCTGGHCHYMGGEADGVTEIQRLMRSQQKKGIDWAKLMATAGGTRGVPQADPFTAEELQAAVTEAHREGMKITMHASRIHSLRKVVESRPDGIEHCQFTDSDWHVVEDKELAELICRYGIQPCHTMAVNVSILSYLQNKPEETWTPEERQERTRQLRWRELMPAQLSFQLSQGITTVGGSDAGWRYTSFRDGMVNSMEMMSLAGMSSIDIIHACTGRNANYLGIGERLGTITPGKQADMLLLSADPSDSISAFRSITRIYKRGLRVEARSFGDKRPRDLDRSSIFTDREDAI